MTKAEMVNEVMKMISDAEKPSTKAVESVLDALDRLNMLKARDVGQMDRFSQMGVKDSFLMSHVQYEALDEKEKRELSIDVQRKAWSWAQEELDERNAQWMIVCGGEVIESSSTLDDFPDEERLAAIGQQCGLVPFVFVRNPVIEESDWSSLSRGDSYPTLPVSVGQPQWTDVQLASVGHSCAADFDTGSPHVFLDLASLATTGIVEGSMLQRPILAQHLGSDYVYHVCPLPVGVQDETGGINSSVIACHCVEDWPVSPFCQVNPGRSALVGRNIVLRLALRMELDGQQRRTRLLQVAT